MIKSDHRPAVETWSGGTRKATGPRQSSLLLLLGTGWWLQPVSRLKTPTPIQWRSAILCLVRPGKLLKTHHPRPAYGGRLFINEWPLPGPGLSSLTILPNLGVGSREVPDLFGRCPQQVEDSTRGTGTRAKDAAGSGPDGYLDMPRPGICRQPAFPGGSGFGP